MTIFVDASFSLGLEYRVSSAVHDLPSLAGAVQICRYVCIDQLTLIAHAIHDDALWHIVFQRKLLNSIDYMTRSMTYSGEKEP